MPTDKSELDALLDYRVLSRAILGLARTQQATLDFLRTVGDKQDAQYRQEFNKLAEVYNLMADDLIELQERNKDAARVGYENWRDRERRT